jgi:hypothetical protein
MTTQLPPREQSGVGRDGQSPDVLFEEARRRRRRRWIAGSFLAAAAIAAGALILGMAGGGGGGVGDKAQGRPSGSGSGASSAHAGTSRLFPAAPSTQNYGVTVPTYCALAPRNRYLPAWSGCVTAEVADLSGDGRPDLILVYSRLSHSHVSSFSGSPSKLYQAKQAMLRVVSPEGVITTAPIPTNRGGTTAAAILAITHVNDKPGKEIFLTIQQISSGAYEVAYGLHAGRLISAGVGLSSGGDSATRTGFDCLPGNPPRLIQRQYELIRGIKVIGLEIYGWWRETTVTYAWHGPRLLKIAQSTVKRRVLPSSDSVGVGCIQGIG